MYVRDKNNRIVTGRGGQPVRAGNIAQVSQTPPLQGGYAPPAAPQARPGVGQQLQGMALNKGINAGMKEAQAFAQPYMDKGLAYGKEALSGLGSMFGGGAGASAAGTGAASGGMGAMMGAAGTAMPYVGMGILAGKALGFFNKGGKVGPLSKASYAANGEKIGVEFLNEYNKDEMSKLSPLQKTQIRQQAVRKAQGMNPEDRAKYVDGLRSRGIDSESMSSSGNNNNKSILEQFFGIK